MDYFVENSAENIKKVTDNLFFFLMCVAKMASSQITLHGKFCASGMFPYFSERHKVVFSLFCVLIVFLNDCYNPQNGQPFKNYYYYYYSHCLIWITFFQVFLFSNYLCQECFFDFHAIIQNNRGNYAGLFLFTSPFLLILKSSSFLWLGSFSTSPP